MCLLGHMRMIPIVGPSWALPAAPAPTPEYKKWPITGETIMAYQLQASHQTTLSVVFTDSRGNPATVDGIPKWSVDNPNVLALKPAPDGGSCVIKPVGPLGTARVSMLADADLSGEVVVLAGVFDVEVTAGQAVTVEITAGEAQPALEVNPLGSPKNVKGQPKK